MRDNQIKLNRSSGSGGISPPHVNDPNPNITETGDNRAGASYNRAVMTLNEKAMEYKDTIGIASDARSIGSLPNDKDYPDYLTGTERSNLYLKNTSDFYEYIQFALFVDKYFASDTNSTSDINALEAIDGLEFDDLSHGDKYWLVSRKPLSFQGVEVPSNRHFYVRIFYLHLIFMTIYKFFFVIIFNAISNSFFLKYYLPFFK